MGAGPQYMVLAGACPPIVTQDAEARRWCCGACINVGTGGCVPVVPSKAQRPQHRRQQSGRHCPLDQFDLVGHCQPPKLNGQGSGE
eukprot:scaffold4697_cov277-Prasinococcus_capsulatus_cf.AAC.5